MAITYRGASNAAGQNAGVTTTAGTTSITPSLPGSTVAGDRVFVVQCGSNTSGTTPTNWTVVGTKDTVVGSGAVAASSGQRYMTVYYRDYDGSWSMPAFTLTSATQNSHWVGAVSITPTLGSVFDTPTISTVGGAFNTAATAYTDTTAASFTTHSGGFLIIGTCLNDNVTSSFPALSQSGATFGTVTERCDGGTATGNDVAGQVHTTSVTTGASATATFTQTLSLASQGETLIVEQTESVAPYPVHASISAIAGNASASGVNIAVPSGVTTGDVILAHIYVESVSAITPPSGFTEAPDSPSAHSAGGSDLWLHVFWKRQTSATGAGETTGTYAFTGPTTWWAGYATRYVNCVTSGNPLDVTTSNHSAGASTTPAVSDTTTVANTLLVWDTCGWSQFTFTPPTGFTERVDLNTSIAFTIADKAQPSAGATGSITGTPSLTSVAMVTWLGALKPAAGSSPGAGTASGAYTWVGSAAGSRTPKGSASGASYTWAGSATGKRAPKATASGAYTWAGSAAGTRTPKASSSGAYTFSGTAAGTRTSRGSSSGSYTWSGAAAGTRTSRGTSSGSYTWSGAAAGKRTPKASSSGAYTFGGAAQGATTKRGTATGVYTWTGSATGSAPTVGVNDGTATGAYQFTGTASGARASRGSASGGFGWDGAAIGWRITGGVASGSYVFTGTATGESPTLSIPEGTATGSYGWTGVALSSGVNSGAAAGGYGWAGRGWGWLTHFSPERLLTAAAEDRTHVVTFEERTATVPAEARTATVPAEARTFTVITTQRGLTVGIP